MTTDKEKTHGRLDKNLKDRDLKLTQPITFKKQRHKQYKLNRSRRNINRCSKYDDSVLDLYGYAG